MTTLELSTLTLKELYWCVADYYQQFHGKPFADRTFRHWRQILEIEPDNHGLFWASDLELLKEAIRRNSQGQTLSQIAHFFKDRINASQS